MHVRLYVQVISRLCGFSVATSRLAAIFVIPRLRNTTLLLHSFPNSVEQIQSLSLPPSALALPLLSRPSFPPSLPSSLHFRPHLVTWCVSTPHKHPLADSPTPPISPSGGRGYQVGRTKGGNTVWCYSSSDI